MKGVKVRERWRNRNAFVNYIVATAAVLACWGIRVAFEPILGGTVPYATLFVATVVATWFGGWKPGAYSVALGLILSWINPPGPAHSVEINRLTVTSSSMYLVVASSIVFAVDAMRRAEASLARERDRFLITLGSVDEGVITVDLENRIQFLNDRAVQLTGCDATSAIGRRFEEVVNLVDNGSGNRLLDLVSSDVFSGDRTSFTTDGLVTGKDSGTTPVADRVAPLKTRDGTIFGVVLTLRDVTRRKQFDAAQRLAETRKDEFLSILAHELRNPLNPLQSALSIVRRTKADPAVNRSSLDIMQRQLDQLVRLVDDLLDVSRIQTGRFELRPAIVMLQASVATALEATRPLFLARAQTLEVDLGNDVHVRGDAARITQICTNILNNASKYTSAGGKIALRIRNEGGESCISIADNGIGLSDVDTERIFDLFTRGDRGNKKVDGLGIGLALAKRLATMHGGRIAVSSAGLGQGSTFTVYLPIHEGAPSPAIGNPVKPATQKRMKKILLVDDNEDGTGALSALLEAMDFEVAVANSGAQALEAVERFEPDAAILDIGLPDMTGLELARRLRAASPPSLKKLVALTGWGAKKDVDAALEAGFDVHITKPITLDKIEALLYE